MFCAFLVLFFASCQEDDGEGAGSSFDGTWRLSQMIVNLDGNQLLTHSPLGFQSSFSASTFSYSDSGQQSGTWSINEEETELTVNYGTTTSVLPIVEKTETTISYTIKTIDLTGVLNQEEQAISLFINSLLNQSGSNWTTATASGQTLTIILHHYKKLK